MLTLFIYSIFLKYRIIDPPNHTVVLEVGTNGFLKFRS
jgi:hypothetical protein